jgi:hypothetical protein
MPASRTAVGIEPDPVTPSKAIDIGELPGVATAHSQCSKNLGYRRGDKTGELIARL